MGGSLWSAATDKEYASRSVLRSSTPHAGFAYDHATKSKPRREQKAHESLDPKKIKNGIRESRDSDAHPTSRALAVFLDVTGSMSKTPRIMQKSLPELMGLLVRKGYLEHPQILIGAIGDVRGGLGEDTEIPGDTTPLQVGQFESGIEVDNDITNLYLEGGGGGQQYESHELALYTMARKTALDCLEKRGDRGYMIIVTDEMCRDVHKSEVLKVIGDEIGENIPLPVIIAELEKKFDVYVIIPRLSSYYNDPTIFDFWAKHLTNPPLKLENPEALAQLIATTIGIAEGKTTIDRVDDDLHEVGTDLAVAKSVKDALVNVKPGEPGLAMAVASSGEPDGLESA